MLVPSFDEQYLLTSKVYVESKKYWMQYLSALSGNKTADLFNRAKNKDQEAVCHFELDKEITEKILLLCRRNNFSVYVFMLTGYSLLVNRYTGAAYVPIAIPLFNESFNTISKSNNEYLPLICCIKREDTFKSLLMEISRMVLDAARHQHYPLGDLYNNIGIETGIFNTYFSCEQLHTENEPGNAGFPFVISLDIDEEKIGFSFSLSSSTAFDIVQFFDHFTKIIKLGAADPSASLVAFSLLSEEETQRQLYEFNDTKTTIEPATIIDLFAKQATLSPDATAVVFEGASLSYRQLNERSNQLAHYLRGKGVKEETLVPTCMDRSLEMITALLGILKAGGAYVPVDPAYPPERIAYLLNDTKATLVVSMAAFKDRCEHPGVEEVICLDSDQEQLAACDSTLPSIALKPDNLAYVIYTSGSTGRPKGVMNEHGGVVNRLHWTQHCFTLNATDAVLQKTTFCFDVSVWELFWPLISGAKLVFAAPDGQKDPQYLKDIIRAQHITTIHFVPSMLSVFLESVEAGEVLPLQRVLCSGEALQLSHVREFRRRLGNVGLHNLYGPTEAAVDVSYWEVPQHVDTLSVVPIGRPVWNTQLYILDTAQRLLPAGAAGELYIGGVQVARGYLNREELTKERFIPNPFGEGRLYRTGDLARWLPDGTIEYLGRIDDQVKIRGYRIELGEVENVLQSAPGIKQAVVLADTDGADTKRLVGYVVVDGPFDKDDIYACLNSRLPEYMVPALLIPVESIPLTSNGKADKKRLAEKALFLTNGYVAPRNDMEKRLAAIWLNLLRVERLGIYDRFFEVGGHSLLAMRVIAAIRKEFGKEVTMKTFFENPTIALLAERLLADKSNSAQPVLEKYDKEGRIPLSFAQERMWVIDKLRGSQDYYMPYVLQLQGELGIGALEEAIRTIITRHEALRTVIREEKGKAYQVVIAPGDWRLQVITEKEITGKHSSVREYIEEVVDLPFDLSSDILLRVHLICLETGEFILVTVIHHIASDGWSMGILVKEVTAVYQSLVTGGTTMLPELPVQYTDYAIWQRQYLTEDVIAASLKYWKQQLMNLQPVELPFDFQRPPEQSNRGKALNAIVDRKVADALLRLSQKEGATLFMTLLAAFKVLLYRYTRQEDLQVASPIAGRQQQEVEGMIGFFVNTLVLRSRIYKSMSFTALLQQVIQTTLQAYEHQELPFEKVVDALQVRRDMSMNPLFQVMFAMQNTPDGGKLDLTNVKTAPARTRVVRSKNDLCLEVVDFPGGLDIAVTYCSDLFKEDTVEQMLSCYIQLLNAIAEHPARQIAQLCMLNGQERALLLEHFNDTDNRYEDNETIIDLFEKQAGKTPEAVALKFEDAVLSYEELNTRANQLACYLSNKGVKPGDMVPLCMERGLEMVTGVLGIMKTGAAYVPIDSAYPEERIRYILEDVDADIVLIGHAQKQGFPAYPLEIIDLQKVWNEILNCPVENAAYRPDPALLAYIIYTSGSTGRPKGVMIGHQNVYSFIRWCQEAFAGSSFEIVYAGTSLCFDLSVFELFYPLSTGRPVRILKDALAVEPWITMEDQVLLNTVPGVIQGLIDGKISFDRVSAINMAGEPIPRQLLKQLDLERIEVRNLYGPTEDTTYTTMYRLKTNGPVLIGKPVSNTKVYIVDEDMFLCPVGVAGELCIGGAGVAKGYLNRPELTKEKFIANPFGQGRLYRTGDLARWLPDGNLEYLGRIDDQVKLRGYRIEPGEIEHVLTESPGVKQAVVVVSTETHPRLIGYVVTTTGYDREAVQSFLSSKLPAYMVPSLLVELDSIPLTHNGKVDRKQLASLEHKTNAAGGYVAPRNETEAALAAIWEELLDVTPIGIHDNFFELGGDSIITIQVVSRARQQGIGLQPRDIFNYQTISRLAAFICEATTAISITGEQGELSGASGLLPVQQWYLLHNGSNAAVSHYNQSVLLSISREVHAAQLSGALKQLLLHHDALRFRYRQAADHSWEQLYGDHYTDLVTADLRAVAVTDFAATVTNIAEHYQQSLDIYKGEIVRMVWIRSPEALEANRLLVIVHHLAIDGVSWRILLEDLEALLKGAVNLGAKTSAYRQWQEELLSYGFTAQQRYWEQVHSGYIPLPADKEHAGAMQLAQAAHCRLKLEAAVTRALLQQVPKVYHTEVNDILLCALAITLGEWTGRNMFHIGLEGHGRESLDGGGMDTSRTVGWFTSMYPVCLSVHHKDPGKQLLSIKDQLRQVPVKGLGYGVLKYLHKTTGLQGKDSWDVVFNYLGQTDNVLREEGWLSGAEEGTGNNRSGSLKGSALLEINSMVASGELQIDWSFSSVHYEASTVEKLAARYLEVLQQLVHHCLHTEPVDSRIPADYGLGGEVSYEELDAFLSQDGRRTALSGLYRLSPLQEGILFHGLYDGAGGAYVEQFSCTITNLDEAVFMAAWQQLLADHSILRSSFYADAFSIPVQCVHKAVRLPVEQLDYRSLPQEEQQQLISEYLLKDRTRGFDFRQAPLMRLALIRLSENKHHLLWTSHHLILDGWSTPVLIEAFLQTYELLINGGTPPPAAEDRYEDYIRYIGAIDKQAAENYWNGYLSGIEEPTLLPFVKDGINRTKGVGDFRQELLSLDGDETAAVEQFCRRHRITVNTLMQGVWSYLLHRYTGNTSVTYGVTVSGRPEDLPGMEQRVGVYTNTVPLHVRIAETSAIATWLQSIQADQLQSRRYQYNSLSELQDLSGLGAALFDTMLTFQNYPVSEVIVSRNWGLQVEAFSIHEQTSNYPLSLRIMSGKQIMVQFIYKEASIENYCIKRIAAHFNHVLHVMLSGSVNRLNELELLPATELNELLNVFNDTQVDYGSATSIVELFTAQTQAHPDVIALLYEDDTLTYKELEERSNQLAHYLMDQGVTAETLVPLCVSRGTAMIVCMLGIMKAGGAYVPLDPSYPHERLRYMLEDTGALLVLTDSRTRDHAGLSNVRMLLDVEADIIKTYPPTATGIRITGEQLAYVIYTSGSTGRPKGVLIEHKGLLNMVQSHKSILLVKPGMRVLQFASMSFDGSCQEIFTTLCNGGSLVIASSEEVLSPSGLGRLLQNRSVALATLPPSYQAVMAGELQGLQLLYSAGEALQAGVGRQIQELGIKLINGYGPTENTVMVTLSEAPLREDGSVTIGRPVSNVQVYIVDSKLRLQPAGVPGELLAGGIQLARGYLNRPELTAEKFIINPFGEGRLYRTGDVARWLPDGQIEYIGRMDDQVKLRGYRIELGEVERVLQESPGVQQGVVVLASATPQRLVGYIVKGPGYNKQAVQAYLSSRLPDYMVPSLLQVLDRFPVTVNGKVDRRQLSLLGEKEGGVTEQAGPRNEVETVLVRIWSELLEVPTVSIYDNFFELGGHSLLAIRMISALRRELGLELDIREIFDHPVISELSGILMPDIRKAGAGLPPIASYDREQAVPLSYSQEQLWFVDRLQGSREYHMPYVFRLRGALNVGAFEEALRDVVDRHEILRTVIKEKEGQGYQYTRDSRDWKLTYVAEGEVDISKLLEERIELSGDWMLKVWLIKESEEAHLLVAVLHHIAFDGWSMSILIRELSQLYRGRLKGEPVVLPVLPVQYGDYAIWQRRYLSADQMAEKIAYWKTQLSAMSPLRLPADYPRPVHQSIRGGTVVQMCDGEVLRSLEKLSRTEGVTLFMTLLSVFKVLLYRYTGQEDLYVGTPVAGRHQQEVEGLIGFFVNTLVLRTEVRASDRFRDVLLRVKAATVEAYAHQEVPFEKVVAALGQERDLSRHPLFDVKFQLENMPEAGELDLGGLRLEGHESLSVKAQMDLSLDVRQMDDGLRLVLTYCADLYREETASRMLNHYIWLLQAVVKHAEERIALLPMLSEEETQRQLYEFNDTKTTIEPATIIDLFAKQAALSPDATAVVFEGASLSYRQLNERSNQLAHYLRGKGVKEETLVPTCMDRSLEMITALLGILKAGGAYVPVDPAYPPERIAYLLNDTKATLVVSMAAFKDRCEHPGVEEVICLDSDQEQLAACDSTLPSIALKPDNLAYVIYTSGSTGRPKGVMNEHGGVVNRLHWTQHCFTLNATDAVLQKTTFCFDVSVWELFWPLISGAKLVFAAPDGQKDPQYLKDIIRAQHITTIHFVPSMLSVFLESVEAGEVLPLQRVLCSGEALQLSHVREFRRRLGNVGLHNLYGPTEAAVDVSYWEVPQHVDTLSVVPIGRPVWNTQLYILDTAQRLLPAGAAGELYIGGVQVARGYLNREELTKERFIPNPFGEGRLYRTGDLARWLPDGTIEYLGRIDDQVKIRGYRIELGEVDTALQQLKEVAGCCVVAKPDAAGGHKLVGYYVPVAAALKSREQQLYEKQVAGWQELYEAEYSQPPTAGSAGDPTFDITGWNDSFTGKAIAPQQMREWVADMVQVILSQQPNRILEIGCGTGLLYYPLRTHIKRYIGTDLSAASVNRIKNHITKEQNNYCATLLQVCAAHEIRLQPHEQIDTVVLNSVAQYFPAAEYLTAVIAKSISLLPGTGRIVIGDVRDLRLQRMFQSRLVIDRLQEGAALQEFNWQVHLALAKEEELCLAPSYFYGLQQQFPAISAVEMRWKEVDFENELSLYRYTVILHVGTPPPQLQLQWQPVNTTAQVLAQLDAGVNMIALQDVPNPRLHAEMALSAALDDKRSTIVGDLSFSIRQENDDCSAVEAIMRYAVSKGYHCRRLLAPDALKMHLVISAEKCDALIALPYEPVNANEPVANLPLYTESCILLQKDLRLQLEQRLPEYMIPTELIALQHLPLTLNGKADRKFLSSREDVKATNTLHYEAPATDLEQRLAAIWQELLGVAKVGLHDNFFELGGHSLLATRVVSAIRKKLLMEVSVRTLFLYPNIKALAVQLMKAEQISLLPSIKVQPAKNKLPLSFSQERLWFIDRLKGSTQYHMPWTFRLQGPLDTGALEEAFRLVITRHEALRTVIREEEGKGYQYLRDADAWQLHCIAFEDLAALGISLQDYIAGLLATPFDLAADFMLKVYLVRLSANEHILAAVAHHIAFDGWSLSILVAELTEIYRSRIANRQPSLKALPVQYADYACWQRDYLTPERMLQKLDHWKQQLLGLEPVALVTDYARPAEQSIRGAQVNRVIGAELTARLQALSQAHGATLFMTMLAAFKVLLFRYTGQSSIHVGTPVAGRQQQELEGLIGFFVNMLVLRSELNAGKNFTEVLSQVKQTTLDAYEHQEVPFEKIVEALGIQRDMSRHPLFDISFQLQNAPPPGTLDMNDVRLISDSAAAADITTQFDIGLDITESGGELFLRLVYCSDLYTLSTIAHLLDHYEQLLGAIVNEPTKDIALLAMLPPDEVNKICTQFNDNSWHEHAQENIIALFARQVRERPDAVAVVYAGDTLTYKQLDQRSNQLAHFLLSKGLTAAMPVGVCLHKSMEMMIAILGILKAGGAYVPLDPAYPPERLAYMVKDAGAALVITASQHLQLFDSAAAHLICVNEQAANIHSCSAAAVNLTIQPDQPAYIMFTSGSTGVPKGVCVTHHNVTSLVHEGHYVQHGCEDALLSTGAVGFDATTFEYWGMLLNGGRLVLCSTDVLLDVPLLKALIAQQYITIMWFTAGWFNELVETDSTLFAPLKTVVAGGDKLSVYHIAQLAAAYPHLQIVNGYGPTENTTFSLSYRVNQPALFQQKEIPIGRPLRGRSAYILDERLQLCGIGVAGELYVGGVGLSLGYVNNEALTTEKFIANPFGKGKLYRTGDLGRWDAEGNVEFLGRRDEQVKIRGYRIEPGEVERVLQGGPGVKGAVVLCMEAGAAGRRLTGYVVADENYDQTALERYLQGKLPEYMLPTQLVQLESIPLTGNGKVDRAALAGLSLPPVQESAYAGARNPLEEALLLIWQELLGIEKIGIYDNFFELGGHSLLVMRALSVIRKEMDIEMSVKTFFQLGTIDAVAKYIRVNRSNGSAEPAHYKAIRL